MKSKIPRNPKKNPRNVAQDLLPLEGNMRIPTAPPGDFSFLGAVKVTRVFSTYWRFAAERQRLFLKRMAATPPPWTDDPVLQAHKFTNAYRASDRVSQYLIRRIIYCDEYDQNDLFFRIMLFKFFNRIETWELLESEFGDIRYKNYSFEHFDRVLSDAMTKGERLYSAAYIMPTGGKGSIYPRKHQMHLKLLETMMADNLPKKISDAATMSDAFNLLRSYPSLGDFLAYQYVTDLNYSPMTNFQESEFVMPGPGAKDGIQKCFSDLGKLSLQGAIKLVEEAQIECFAAVNESFPTLWGRKLQLIDCQNLFCEVDKYARVAHPEVAGLTGRVRIKQKLKPSSDPLELFYPPKWGINQRLTEEPENVPSSAIANR